MTGQLVGTIAALYRYPVKSMRGEALAAADLGPHGLTGDWRYAFVRAGNASAFPWLTARQVPDLLRYAPYFAGPGDPDRATVRVLTPDGADFAIDSPALRDELAARYGAPVALHHARAGVPDAAPVSLLGAASVDDLAAIVGAPLAPLRFRPNIVIAAAGGQPYAEDGWVGRTLALGEGAAAARVRVDQRDPRCAMVTLDPADAARNPAVLRAIAALRDNCLGVYGAVEQPGPLRAGDPVYLLDR